MTKKEVILAIQTAIAAAQKLERSRDASIAITHLETAELWIKK